MGPNSIRFIATTLLVLVPPLLHADVSQLRFGKPWISSFCTQNQGQFRAMDLDGDGNQDIVHGGCIAWGNGKGQFPNVTDLSPMSIASAGVFSKKTNPALKDLILCTRMSNGMSCALAAQTGKRKFAPPEKIQALSLDGMYIEWIESLDYDLNGSMDLVAAVRHPVAGGVYHGMLQLLPSNGKSGFNTAVLLDDLGNGSTQNGLGGVGIGSIAVGDIDGDKRLDIAAVVTGFNEKSSATVVQLRAYFSRPSGKFSVQILEGSSISDSAGAFFQISPMSLAIGDYNGDGRQDIVVTDEGGINDFPGFTTFVRNKGNGKLEFDRIESGPNHNESVDLSDLDGDAKADVLISGGTDFPHFSINSVRFPAPENTAAIFGDFNGDGRKDVAVRLSRSQNRNFAILLQR